MRRLDPVEEPALPTNHIARFGKREGAHWAPSKGAGLVDAALAQVRPPSCDRRAFVDQAIEGLHLPVGRVGGAHVAAGAKKDEALAHVRVAGHVVGGHRDRGRDRLALPGGVGGDKKRRGYGWAAAGKRRPPICRCVACEVKFPDVALQVAGVHVLHHAVGIERQPWAGQAVGVGCAAHAGVQLAQHGPSVQVFDVQHRPAAGAVVAVAKNHHVYGRRARAGAAHLGDYRPPE